MDRRKIDVGMASILIAISLLILTDDSLVEGGVETELGSMFLPRIVAFCIMLLAATIGIGSLRRLTSGAETEEGEIIDVKGFDGVLIYILIFALYWFAVPYVGFLVATPFAMFAIAYLLGGRNWIPIILMSVLTPIVLFYLCREFLRVFLPTWSF